MGRGCHPHPSLLPKHHGSARPGLALGVPLWVGCAVPPTPQNSSREDGAEVGAQPRARLGPQNPTGVRAVPALGSPGELGGALGSRGEPWGCPKPQVLLPHSPQACWEPRANILRTFGESQTGREGRAARWVVLRGKSSHPGAQTTNPPPTPVRASVSPGCCHTAESPPVLQSAGAAPSPRPRGAPNLNELSRGERGDSKATNVPSYD